MAEFPVRSPPAARPVDARVRVLAALSVLTVAGTYLAAQIDFLRRHTLGFPPVEPKKYWWPQVTHIWMPGLGAALVLAVAAFLLHRRRRSD
jgi:nitric oxide reductase large subunit